mmetsp:Transcript_28021/g.58275  ORF Transcript_28021/g.58275 Transcript_28021/m.58275 type:complete len:329 (+) Transcript_28021:1203-2189(+)
MIPASGNCWNAFIFDNFESGVFPSLLWSTSGDGSWFIDDKKTIGGSYSIRSPDMSDLEGFYSLAQSNATIVTCTDFSGGSLLLNILAGFTTSSVDFLSISIDGRRVITIVDGTEEFSTVSIQISSGRHIIDFSYNQNYIIPNLSELFPSISDNFFGAGVVWLDNVSITPGPAVADYSPCLIGYCEITLSDECFMKYKLNVTEESLSVELLYNGIGWLGWAISNDGAMEESEAVIGFPVHGSAPHKYNLGGKSTSLVVPMEEDKQTLIDVQVMVFDDPDQTAMKFTKSLQEANEIDIIRGDNSILWAHGTGFGSELSYHSNRGFTVLNT